MNARLNGTYRQIDLQSAKLTIGRAPDNILVLNDSQVSGHHAEIRQDSQVYSVIDLGSTNGTYINDYPLTPHVPQLLNVNDRLRFGQYTGHPETTFTYTMAGTPGIDPTVRAPSSTYNAPSQQGYQQQYSSNNPAPSSWQQQGSKKEDVEGKWSWRDWLVKVAIPVLGILVAAGFFTVKAATPSIPQLHQTYSGHLTSATGTASLFITSVNQTSDGNFTATGTDPCPIVLQNGKISTDNTVSFELKETPVVGTQCGLTGEFKGTMRSDGSLSGTWDVPNTSIQGAWDLS